MREKLPKPVSVDTGGQMSPSVHLPAYLCAGVSPWLSVHCIPSWSRHVFLS